MAAHVFHSIIDDPDVLAKVSQHSFLLYFNEPNFGFYHQAIEHLASWLGPAGDPLSGSRASP